MLPEHVAQLNHDLAETKKIDKPIIDERQTEEFELTIAYAISVNKPLTFQFLINVYSQLLQIKAQEEASEVFIDSVKAVGLYDVTKDTVVGIYDLVTDPGGAVESVVTAVSLTPN